MNISHLPLEHHRASVGCSYATAALAVMLSVALGAAATAWAIAFLI